MNPHYDAGRLLLKDLTTGSFQWYYLSVTSVDDIPYLVIGQEGVTIYGEPYASYVVLRFDTLYYKVYLTQLDGVIYTAFSVLTPAEPPDRVILLGSDSQLYELKLAPLDFAPYLQLVAVGLNTAQVAMPWPTLVPVVEDTSSRQTITPVNYLEQTTVIVPE